MSKPMSAQVCEACHSAPATKVANPLTSHLCVSCRKKLGIFVAQLRSIKTPVTKPTQDEYNQYISSLNEASTATVNDNDSTVPVNGTAEPTTVNTTPKSIKFSSDDELTKRMVNTHVEPSTEPVKCTAAHPVGEQLSDYSSSSSDTGNRSSSPASEEESDSSDTIMHEEEEELADKSSFSDVSDAAEEESCSSDTNEPVAENNCSEMDASTDAPIVSAAPRSVIEEPSAQSVNDSGQLDLSVNHLFTDVKSVASAVSANVEHPKAKPSIIPFTDNKDEVKRIMRLFHCNRKTSLFTHCYEKHDVPSSESNPTGIALNLAYSIYAVIDIDFRDSASEEERDAVRSDLLNIEGCRVVRTTSGGLHMYCLYDNTWDDKGKNRFTGIYKCQHYAIDIFIPGEIPSCKNKGRSLVMLPPSLVKNHQGKISTYTLVKECDDSSMLSFTDLLNTVLARPHAKIVAAEKASAKHKQEQCSKPSGSSNDDAIDALLDLVEPPSSQGKQTQCSKPSGSSNDDTDAKYKSGPPSKELFDAIVAGFDKSFEIHGDCNAAIDKEVSILPLVTALHACECSEIPRSYIDDAKDTIYSNGGLTAQAKAKWGDLLNRYRKDKSDNWGVLLKMLRIHNSSYFNKHILPLISAKESFVTSDFTFDDYKMKARFYRTRYQHLNALARCVAITTDNDYIVKKYKGENVCYELIKHRQMHSSVLDFVVKYEASEDDKNHMRDRKKKVTDEITSKVGELLNYVNMTGDFKLYSGMSLKPSSRELWSYRPPIKTEYNRLKVIEWIDLAKSIVVNERPLMEEIYSHAYRLRNPGTFIEKFFVHRGPHNAGKSFVAAGLGKIYPGLAQIGGKTDHATKDLFNSWVSKRLMIHFEEADTDNYRNKDFETFVKQVTSPEGSGRGMYKETEAVKHTAIVGMNTNDPTIFGLIRSDDATIDRLVIIEFKPPKFNEREWCDVARYYYEDPTFAYSLYHYLLNELEIPSDFSYSRYRSPEKYAFIKAAKENARNSVELWIESVVDEYKAGCSNIAFKKNFRAGEYVYMHPSKAGDSYRQYVKYNQFRCPVQPEGLKNSLIALGFAHKGIKIDSKPFYAFVIKEDAFIALSQNATCVVDDDFICDDERKPEERTAQEERTELVNQVSELND